MWAMAKQDAQMHSKDCYIYKRGESAGRALRRCGRAGGVLTAVLVAAGAVAPVEGGSARMWSTAVVLGDRVRVSDLCELSGFSESDTKNLAELVVADAPPVGGSRIVHMKMIRSALRAGGANMALLTVRGARRCTVTRPSTAVIARPKGTSVASNQSPPDVPGRRKNSVEPTRGENPETLRSAVRSYFDQKLHRFGGRAEVVFQNTNQQMLDLSGPTYTFVIRAKNDSPLGLIQLEVEVRSAGATVQTVPLVVQVTMVRNVVVARRGIGQDATIQPADVEVVPLRFSRLSRLGVASMSQVVGQRAKRYVAAGTTIELGMLESIPLIKRGQFVRLTSVSGGIRIVTTGKAMRDGFLGDLLPIRSSGDKRVEIEAIVVGPGAAQVGGAPLGKARVALGGGS